RAPHRRGVRAARSRRPAGRRLLREPRGEGLGAAGALPWGGGRPQDRRRGTEGQVRLSVRRLAAAPALGVEGQRTVRVAPRRLPRWWSGGGVGRGGDVARRPDGRPA